MAKDSIIKARQRLNSDPIALKAWNNFSNMLSRDFMKDFEGTLDKWCGDTEDFIRNMLKEIIGYRNDIFYIKNYFTVLVSTEDDWEFIVDSLSEAIEILRNALDE